MFERWPTNCEISTICLWQCWKFIRHNFETTGRDDNKILHFALSPQKRYLAGKFFKIFCFPLFFSIRIYGICVRVCLYSSTVKASSHCKMFETYLRSTDKRCYVVSIIPGAPAKFLHLYFQKCYISLRKTKLQVAGNWRENDMIYDSANRWYILI